MAQRLLRDGVIQAKLTVNQPGDRFEQEADRVAEQVLAMPAHADMSSAPPRIQRFSQQSSAQMGAAPASVDNVLAIHGRPLDPALRQDMEQRFGYDFSGVRVHSGRAAEQSAKDVSAHAYTAGHDIVFGGGNFAPGTHEGRGLLAHELTHVMQQRDHTNLQRKPKSKENKKHPAKQKPPEHNKEETPEATSPSAGALKAIEAAKNLSKQTDPAIWFDSWGNDLRDNNRNGKIDDKSEQRIADGDHYGKTFDAMICKDPGDTTDSCPKADQSKIKVNYKVCIDVPIESYKAAGVSISTNRWIPSFFGELKKKPDWTVWKKPARPSSLLDGDIVAAANPDHQHAGIVETGLFNSVINLPGPTSSRKFHMFNPSGRNDMKSVPRVLFEKFLSIDFIARSKK